MVEVCVVYSGAGIIHATSVDLIEKKTRLGVYYLLCKRRTNKREVQPYERGFVTCGICLNRLDEMGLE